MVFEFRFRSLPKTSYVKILQNKANSDSETHLVASILTAGDSG